MKEYCLIDPVSNMLPQEMLPKQLVSKQNVAEPKLLETYCLYRGAWTHCVSETNVPEIILSKPTLSPTTMLLNELCLNTSWLKHLAEQILYKQLLPNF